MGAPDSLTPIATYRQWIEGGDRLQEACSLTVGEGAEKIYIGPTRKGGVVLDFGQPGGGTAMSIERLKAIRNVVNLWLTTVAGE